MNRTTSTRMIGILFLSLVASLATADNNKWVGSWATAVSPPNIFDVPTPDPPYSDQTLRQVVRLSVGGSHIRIRLTNVHGTEPLQIDAVTVALRDTGADVIAESLTAVTFGGSSAVTVPPGTRLISDPVELPVPDLADLAVSIYIPAGGAVMGSTVSYHVRGLQTSYVFTGNTTNDVAPIPDSLITSTFWISGVDAYTGKNTPVLAAIGDSITDGDQSTVDANKRWPNQLAERLLQANGPDGNRGGRRVGILNAGISGNQVTQTFLGDSALVRFERDVLTQTGVTHVLLLEGINDIGINGFFPPNPAVTAAQIIAGYMQLIAQAHAQGLKIIGGTLTPSGGFFLPDYNTPAGEAKRQTVNDWIRNSGAFDYVVDFDAVLRDPADPTMMRVDLTADGLHPNDDGYKAMSDAIKRRVFAKSFGG